MTTSNIHHPFGSVQTKIYNRNKVFCIGLLPDSELGYGVITTESEMVVLYFSSGSLLKKKKNDSPQFGPMPSHRARRAVLGKWPAPSSDQWVMKRKMRYKVQSMQQGYAVAGCKFSFDHVQ